MNMNIDVGENSSFEETGIIKKDGCALSIGSDSMISGRVIFEREQAKVNIGSRVFMNGTIVCANNVSIGDDVLIAWGVTVVDHDSHSLCFSERKNDVVNWKRGIKKWDHVKMGEVSIGNKVWIGFNSIILKGLKIGEGAVVGAGSVVTKDVPPWTLVAGNPAKIIRVLETCD